MTFEITYSGSAETINVFASNQYTKGNEFFDKMDALVRKGIRSLDEMQELCREFFEDGEAQAEGGMLDWEAFNTYGRIEVDGEKIELGDDWEDAYKKQTCEPADERANLIKKNGWCVVYTVQNKSAWSVTIEEDDFDKEKLNWKDCVVHYGDTPIEDDIAGSRPIAEEICLCVDFFEGHGDKAYEEYGF